MSIEKCDAEGTKFLGKWFQTYVEDDGGKMQRQYQGQIVGEAHPGFFLVQLYSAWDGAPTFMQIFHVKEMSDWRFYVNNEHMMCADGCPERSSGTEPCGKPITHVVKSGFFGKVYRCESCSEFFAGEKEELEDTWFQVVLEEHVK